jgi:hypothetical protein
MSNTKPNHNNQGNKRKYSSSKNIKDIKKKSKNDSSNLIKDDSRNKIIFTISPMKLIDYKIPPQETSNTSNTLNMSNEECPGLYCDHTENVANVYWIRYEYFNLPSDYKFTIDDLIYLGGCYHCKLQTKYNDVELYKLAKLIEPLTELKKLIGMKNIKEEIVEQILFFVQNLEETSCDMLHTIISGPPGVGKTEFGKILGKIYLNLGFLKNDIFKIVKRSDFIAGYTGQTALKTQALIDECDGGVLFLDAGHSMGNRELRDVFSKESIDTITANLTEKRNFIFMIAGYPKDLDECMFAYNAGLRRRFSIEFTIEKYNHIELMEIFKYKLNNIGWSIHETFTEDEQKKFFEKHCDKFKYFGGDMETLLLFTKRVHSNRAIGLNNDDKKKIILGDIDNALKRFIKNRNLNDKQNEVLSYFT